VRARAWRFSEADRRRLVAVAASIGLPWDHTTTTTTTTTTTVAFVALVQGVAVLPLSPLRRRSA
jgi:hypothetical protein